MAKRCTANTQEIANGLFMKNSKSPSATIKATSAIAAVALGIAMCFGPLQPQAALAADKPAPTVVHLSNYSNDVHAVMMALKIARMLQDASGDVALFVDLEGTRLADKRVPDDLKWGQADTTVSELLKAFIDAGGEVHVCPHCAKAAGLDEANLRDGCAILTPKKLTTLLTEAGKIMDY